MTIFRSLLLSSLSLYQPFCFWLWPFVFSVLYVSCVRFSPPPPLFHGASPDEFSRTWKKWKKWLYWYECSILQFWVNYEYLYDAGVKTRDPEGQNSTIFVDHREWTFSFLGGSNPVKTHWFVEYIHKTDKRIWRYSLFQFLVSELLLSSWFVIFFSFTSYSTHIWKEQRMEVLILWRSFWCLVSPKLQ